MRASEPERIRSILARARTIAMVGASPDPWRPSFGVMRYLGANGFKVVPVNPTQAGETLHGETVVASLADAPVPVDLVNVFRRPEAVGAVVDEAIAAGIGAIWLQLGVVNAAAAARAEAAGIEVVMDRCISVEHRRLAGR